VLFIINEETFLTREDEPLGGRIACLYRGRTAVLGGVAREGRLNEISYLAGDNMELFRTLEGTCPRSIVIGGGWTFTTQTVRLL
jgi:hypothetical protein